MTVSYTAVDFMLKLHIAYSSTSFVSKESLQKYDDAHGFLLSHKNTSIDTLDGAVNDAVEPEASQDSNRSTVEPEEHCDHARVRQIHSDGEGSIEVQPSHEKPYRIEHHIYSSASTVPK